MQRHTHGRHHRACSWMRWALPHLLCLLLLAAATGQPSAVDASTSSLMDTSSPAIAASYLASSASTLDQAAAAAAATWATSSAASIDPAAAATPLLSASALRRQRLAKLQSTHSAAVTGASGMTNTTKLGSSPLAASANATTSSGAAAATLPSKQCSAGPAPSASLCEDAQQELLMHRARFLSALLALRQHPDEAAAIQPFRSALDAMRKLETSQRALPRVCEGVTQCQVQQALHQDAQETLATLEQDQHGAALHASSPLSVLRSLAEASLSQALANLCTEDRCDLMEAELMRAQTTLSSALMAFGKADTNDILSMRAAQQAVHSADAALTEAEGKLLRSGCMQTLCAVLQTRVVVAQVRLEFLQATNGAVISIGEGGNGEHDGMQMVAPISPEPTKHPEPAVSPAPHVSQPPQHGHAAATDASCSAEAELAPQQYLALLRQRFQSSLAAALAAEEVACSGSQPDVPTPVQLCLLQKLRVLVPSSSRSLGKGVKTPRTVELMLTPAFDPMHFDYSYQLRDPLEEEETWPAKGGRGEESEEEEKKEEEKEAEGESKKQKAESKEPREVAAQSSGGSGSDSASIISAAFVRGSTLSVQSAWRPTAAELPAHSFELAWSVVHAEVPLRSWLHCGPLGATSVARAKSCPTVVLQLSGCGCAANEYRFRRVINDWH